MQIELMALHKKLGITFVYITHSQEEALTLSDRIILMSNGRIAQSGPSTELFDSPSNAFVARFMGVENCLDAEFIETVGSRATVRVGDRVLQGRWTGGEDVSRGTAVTVAVRAESIRLSENATSADQINVIPCQAGGAVYKGKYLDRMLTTDVGELKARIWDAADMPATPKYAWWKADNCIVTRK